jgi:hypothetical protein
MDSRNGGSWVNKPDPFYPTYTRENIAMLETFAEWNQRVSNNPSHFEINPKPCIPGGFQEREAQPVMTMPLAEPVRPKIKAVDMEILRAGVIAPKK